MFAPDKSPQPRAVGDFRSAVAVHAASRRWGASFITDVVTVADFVGRGVLLLTEPKSETAWFGAGPRQTVKNGNDLPTLPDGA
jgi:hypothetical protein